MIGLDTINSFLLGWLIFPERNPQICWDGEGNKASFPVCMFSDPSGERKQGKRIFIVQLVPPVISPLLVALLDIADGGGVVD